MVCERIHGEGGWYTHTQNLCGELVSRGHDVSICCQKDAEENADDILPPPLRCLSFLPSCLRASLALRKVIEKIQPDIIHITVEPYALLIPLIPSKWRKRTVLTIHGNYGIRTLMYFQTRWLAHRFYKQIPKFITVSNYTKDVVAKQLAKKSDESAQEFKNRTTVIHNGIKLPERNTLLERASERSEEASRETAKLLDSLDSASQNLARSKKVLHVGGVKPAKGVGEAIEACAIYKEKYGTPFHLKIIGRKKNDHYMKKLKELIDKKSLHDAVTFCGVISNEELAEAYKNADLLLVPSYTTKTSFEGFGLVYIEANAYGVPVIGPNTSGAAEAIKDGVSGFTVEVFDPEEIAQKMHWVLDEGEIDSGKCRKWAEKHDIAKMIGKTESVYESVAYDLRNLTKKINTDNKHDLIDWGPSVGKEA